MIKIGFAGIPGTGKTTQTQSLFNELSLESTVGIVKEYARDYISKHGIMENIWEEYKIFDTQLAWEEQIIKSDVEFLVTDSPLPLIYLYSTLMHKINNEKDDMVLQDIFKRQLKVNNPVRYDIIFYCPDVLHNDLTVLDDNVRRIEQLDKSWRKEHDEFCKVLFNMFPPKKFHILESLSVSARSTECLLIIKDYIKKEIESRKVTP
jgi:nicotinamide riboside kinase